jgi:hypothetical protein
MSQISLTFQVDMYQEINRLTTLTAEVKISSEVRAYLHNIVVFMRLHRAVAGGISAMATRHFNMLSQSALLQFPFSIEVY